MSKSDATAADYGAGSGLIGPSLSGTATVAGGAVLAVWAWIDLFARGLTATPGSAIHVAYDLVWVFGAACLLVGVVAADARYREHGGPVAAAGLVVSGLGFLAVGVGRAVHAAAALPVASAGAGETLFWGGIAAALVGGFVLAVAGYLTGAPDRLVSGLLAIAPSAMLLEVLATTWLPPELTGAAAGFGVALVPLGVAWAVVGKDVRDRRAVPAGPAGPDPEGDRGVPDGDPGDQ